MERISRTELFMSIASLLSKRATCLRGSVGALITQNNRIVSTGYNGPVSGEVECNEKICDLSIPCKRSIHAEVNAIYAAAKIGIPTEGATLYSTTAPCVNCARAIIQAGIIKVVYMNKYTNDDGLKTLGEAKIITEEYNKQ